MRNPFLLSIFTFSFVCSLNSATYPSDFSEAQVVTGLVNPTAMAFAPDGRLFVCQQGGSLRVIKNGSLLATPFLTVTVSAVGERGLLGVAFDPNFTTNQYVYVYYTAIAPAIHNRVSRFTASGDVAVGNSETVVVDLDNLSSAANHNGGAIHFGPDGKLYVAVGDNGNSANAQSLTKRLGKMLRINPDGSIPVDNPFLSSTSGANQAIWAIGLRNPFTFGFQPGTGRMFINDVGEISWEEINEGIAGSNYGWPATEGVTSNPAYRSPIYAYGHGASDTTGCAITGGAFYNPATSEYPPEYTGVYFFADYCYGWIRKIDPANGNAVSAFATGTASAVDLTVGPDGLLYYLTRGAGGAVYRILHSSTNQAPTITNHPQSQTVSAGQPATFSVTATGTAPLSYQWQRNGAAISGATSSAYTIPAVSTPDNNAQFRCVVSNTAGTATSNSATLTVTANTQPTATITAPATGTLYSGGSTINYAGTGTDPQDGNLPASAFTWQVDFHHDTHTHPFLPAASGATGGSFTIPNTGETASNVWYRIYLTVRDGGGMTHTTFRDVQPRRVVVTLAASPSGMQLTLDGQPVATPYSFTGVVGIIRSIGATSPQQSGGVSYVFRSWSDGGAQTHSMVTPATATTYTAQFDPVVAGAARALYSFDEGAGTVVNDSSGNQNTGAITGAIWAAQGRYGRALSFNGSSSFIRINDANSLDLSNGTLEAWVQLASLGRWHGVIAKGDANDDGRAHNYAIEINAANRVRCTVGNGPTANIVTSVATVPSGQFIHLACTFDATSLRLYINGLLDSSATKTITPFNNTSAVYIGQYGGNSDRLHGLIDEVRIYNRALSLQEIQSDMNTAVTPGTPPPDTIPPTVTMTSPASGSTVSNTITISANATDNVGVAGVQFLLDGGNLGAQDTTAPYSISWNTVQAANGSHTLSARAIDTGGRTTTSTAVTVLVSNATASNSSASYSFNEGTGTAVNDTSGNQNTGVINGAIWSEQGRYGGALSFNGSSSFIRINDANSLDLSVGTLEAWVQLASLGRWHGVIAKGDVNDDGRAHNYAIEINAANRAVCTVGNGPSMNIVTSVATVPSGQFIHLACTFDSTSLKLYINGLLDRSVPKTITPFNNTSAVYIGQYGGNSDRLHGLIDEVRIYNRALTLQEIQADQNRPIGP